MTNAETKLKGLTVHGSLSGRKHNGNTRKEQPILQDSNTIFEPPGHSKRRREHLKQRSPLRSRIRNTTVNCGNAQNSKRLVSSLNAQMISAFKSAFFSKGEQIQNYRQF